MPAVKEAFVCSLNRRLASVNCRLFYRRRPAVNADDITGGLSPDNRRLEGLEEDQCLQLLNSHAFADVENPNDYKRLRFIAGEIVKKLSGSPLAAKVIGGVLNSSLDERHWTKVLNGDFLSPNLGHDGIFVILRLSYMFLPKHLQNCFAFCSIFRQDYMFDKDDLVQMWIALGFIQQPHDQEWTMEDIGGMYFDVLVKKSFFDQFGHYYKMHDLIHELAQSISIQECLRVEDSTNLSSIIPKTLRHLFVQTTNPDIIKKIGQFKYLHSLFLFDEASNQDISALIKIFKTWRSLRLLYIHASTNLKMIPEEIGNLIHLRYLKIDGNCKLIMLPSSLSNLYHLEYIICEESVGLSQPNIYDFLPSNFNNLSNLRYMKFRHNYISSICGIGKLKSLQNLNMFDLRDVSGYRIGELENMNDLCSLTAGIPSFTLPENRRLTEPPVKVSYANYTGGVKTAEKPSVKFKTAGFAFLTAGF
ncbi:putative disease resistance protein RGA3 [Dendrobium catenatum]|uniref:putative disease resistance protein RGA3 n=1 Tax=Dendrobium catenatum TaxID=906689 RepID=UPI00109F4E3C|nr:putative disease resistance protein RGA3 [Dendrobium catenatum]